MKFLQIKFTFLLIWLLIGQSAISQTLKLDLANYKPGKTHQLTYDHNKIEGIILNNIHPGINKKGVENEEFVYSINYEIVTIPMPLLKIVALENIKNSNGADKNDPCTEFTVAYNAATAYLDNSKFNESDWKEKHLNKLQKYLDDEKCNNHTLKESVEDLISNSSRIEPLAKPIKIKRGQQLKIFVSRGVATKTVWEFVIDGEEVGRWFVHYGYGMVSPFNDHGGHFFAQKNDNSDDFTVAKMQKRGSSTKFLPSIMYSFIPYKSYNKNFTLSLTGGLGANSDNIAVLFGVSMFFWENLGANLYVAGINQSVLKGRYNKDGSSIVGENLDFDALHDEEFKPHFGFSVSFRFSDNPFTKAKKEE